LKKHLVEFVNDSKLNDTVFFHEPVPYANLIAHTIAADFGINLLEPFNLSKKFASPNKLFEYMQAEIPVLCSYSPENDLVFQNYSLGEQCEIDTESIKDAILKLSQKSVAEIELYKKDSRNAKSKYCWGNQEKLLLKNIEYLTKNEK
jgi:glycosyltransferase involved in cell wall biosynthesis